MTNTEQVKFRVCLLLDKNNNWLEPFVENKNLSFWNDKRFDISLSHEHSSVSNQDIVFILGYTKILDADFLNRNRLNLVIHESALPLGKGFSPVQWQILEGKAQIPVCLIEATSQVDTGNILLRATIEFNGLELYDEIREKQAATTVKLINDFLLKYPNLERAPQNGKESFFKRRSAKDGELDPDRTIREQFNLFRIGNNELWPTYFFIRDQKFILKIYKADD
jgi:methionyl-tRNA formyltransferase